LEYSTKIDKFVKQTHYYKPFSMKKENNIQLFESKKVRTIWDTDQEKWYFSVIDVIEVLTETERPRKYWSDLKNKLEKEGSQLSDFIGQLKMNAPDGKMRFTDVADTEQVFRLIQSIPSPKAEPFKLWLAKIASERLDEIQDPELTIDRALEQYLQLGYSENWINQRLKSIEIRKELTDEWKNRGIKEGQQFAILTDIISKAWSDKTTKEYKILKGLKKENLRDNMTNTELILNMLAEASVKDISQAINPESFEESKVIAAQGGNVANVARKELELKTGKKVVSTLNAKSLLQSNNKEKQ
jgi:BRO family, N-terminal domain